MPISAPPSSITSRNQYKERIMLIRYGMPKENNLAISVFVLSSSYAASSENRLYFSGDFNTRVSIDSFITNIKGLSFIPDKIYVVHDQNYLNPRLFIDFFRNYWNRYPPFGYPVPDLLTAQLHTLTLLDFLNAEVGYFQEGAFPGGLSTINNCLGSGGLPCDNNVSRMISTLYSIARSYYPMIS